VPRNRRGDREVSLGRAKDQETVTCRVLVGRTRCTLRYWTTW
jgi:hypothetical protein